MNPTAWRLRSYEVLPSTSDLCRSLAEAGEPDGLAVLARRQTRGRGSRGREWVAPEGNLNLSVLMRPPERTALAGQWSLLAAVALAEALSSPSPSLRRAGVEAIADSVERQVDGASPRPDGTPPPLPLRERVGVRGETPCIPVRAEFHPSPVPSLKGRGEVSGSSPPALREGRSHRGEVKVKWPNDLLLDGRKLAGILLDSADDGRGGLAWLVIGMGVNLRAAPDLDGRAIALNTDEPPESIAAGVLARLGHWRRVRLLEGFAPIRAAWLARAPEIGAPVTLRLGPELLRAGQFDGLGDDGSLLLRTGGRVHAFTTGEIMLREAN